MKLISKEEIIPPNETYNLHIKNDHNYIANGAVVANCHGVRGTILKDLLTGPMAKVPIRWGVTGTLPEEELERLSLKISIGDVVGTLEASTLQDAGVLSSCHINVEQLIDYTEYSTYQQELKYLVDTQKRLEYIAERIIEISKSGNTLVLFSRTATGNKLEKLIPGSVFIYGGTKQTARKIEFDEIATLNNKVLLATSGIAAVGINLPRLFNIVLIEAGKSWIRVIQSIGRGLRKSHDKDHVEIWDICSTSKFSKRHLSKRKSFYKTAKYNFDIKKVDWQ